MSDENINELSDEPIENEELENDQVESEEEPELEIPAEEDEDVEIDGKKFALPKSVADKLKAERLMQADYTRKTQEVAETRRQIEARAAEIHQQAQDQEKYVAEYAEVISIDRQLQQYAQINWAQLIDNDPTQAMKLDHERRALQSHRDQLAQSVTQKRENQTLLRQQETAKSLQEGRATLEREIPGWSNELAAKLLNYGSEIGFPKEVMNSIANPNFVKALHKSYMYDQLVKKQAAKPKPAPQEKPVTRLSAAKAGAVKDPEKMSADEWLKWRNSQVTKRR